jgi:hypothetical protein
MSANQKKSFSNIIEEVKDIQGIIKKSSFIRVRDTTSNYDGI